MSDLVGEAKFLKFHYTTEESLLDKDILKNKSWDKFEYKVKSLFLLPLGFQCWQISLINNVEKAELYRKVRHFKVLTLLGALSIGIYEKIKLERYWVYLNRFYPEPTQLQKSLYRDAMMFKELNYQEKSLEDRQKLDSDTVKIYEQMYRLPPQLYPDPEDDPNPASVKSHYT
ncbi:UNKNOWN [Stylonychia lemnae]|uniref:Uncharacterized protein n=1 Tax=Stylonychia lemnae TaxID=5949 RepID=A0A078B0Q5_STYLE|nr:UNKNOWN [Stylonychia lemnae]|eukprot:CDW88129.1 UNKNOWN [Stylonychia lemnae]